MAFVLGITGGIATGKTVVLRMMGEMGARTLSADDIAREVLARDTPAYHETVRRFGRRILAPDGQVDRSALAAIVFADDDARLALNDITHPGIIAKMQEEIDLFRAEHPERGAVLAVEIPLLVECGLEGMVDEVLLVASEQETQVSRLTSRSGVSREEALRRIGAQTSLEHKIAHADRVIWNDGTLESLRQSVSGVWAQICLL